MKFKLLPFLMLSVCAMSLSAEIYYFDTQKFKTYNKDIKLSESLSFDNGGTTDYFWYVLDSQSNKVYQTVLPNFASTSDSF